MHEALEHYLQYILFSICFLMITFNDRHVSLVSHYELDRKTCFQLVQEIESYI